MQMAISSKLASPTRSEDAQDEADCRLDASMRKMICVVFSAISALVLSTPLLSASEIEATASPNGWLLVEGSQILSDACLKLADFTSGEPKDTVEITNAQAFTLRIEHSGAEMCAQMISEVPFDLRVRDDRSRPFVIVYRVYEGFPEHIREIPGGVFGQVVPKGFLE